MSKSLQLADILAKQDPTTRCLSLIINLLLPKYEPNKSGTMNDISDESADQGASNTALAFAFVNDNTTVATMESRMRNTVYNIGLDGDLIIIAGQEGIKIKMSSGFFKFVSPVFEAMLYSEMKEGVAYRKKSEDTFEITLPEDRGVVVLGAFRALYGCNPEAGNLPSDVVRDIAIFINKVNQESHEKKDQHRQHRTEEVFAAGGRRPLAFWRISVIIVCAFDLGLLDCSPTKTSHRRQLGLVKRPAKSNKLTRPEISFPFFILISITPPVLKVTKMSDSTPVAADQDHQDSSRLFPIALDGDIVLVVGPDRDRIQVTSDFLKHISPVFRAMLNAPMNKGEALRDKKVDMRIEISLPEDDFCAMYPMLQILYGADFDKQDVEFDRIMELQSWPTSTTDFDEYWDKLIVAHILKNDWAFFETSCALVEADGSYIQWAIDSPDKTLGMQLAWALDELRSYCKGPPKRKIKGLCLYCFNKSVSKGGRFNKVFSECESDFH
ncbi:hypothetical protein F53441_8539 [Fusarium austroafricanum]|uniref:BTB domain-containing protein n=1 Tax=Fusarium austroafricanum TaxID=2364996 RepID=A0A8H4KDX2_9HYPO|nr:hypothetical protein F53441_8539 [Fusarium austroafricanum]